jgi:hypothetical protein
MLIGLVAYPVSQSRSFLIDVNKKTFSKLVHQAVGPASDATGQTPRLTRKTLNRKKISRKTYQRGSRGWRACPW